MTAAWTHDSSPFHEGEIAVQKRAGVRDRAEMLARRVVRDYMPDQHREFYTSLPFLILGSVDDQGRPWASLLAGEEGFVQSPDPTRLSIKADPLPGDPLVGTLKSGAQLGVLGLEPTTRRRNRMTGTATMRDPEGVDPGGFDIDVVQAFGNCPKFIQTREFTSSDRPTTSLPKETIIKSTSFDEHAQKVISNADTLFIASCYTDPENAPASGGDVSHRGGKPGFVRIEDQRTLSFPDFSGNKHFNTLGNLHLNPKAGLLFINFDRNDLYYMTGTAKVIWEGDDLSAFEGAERLVRFELDECIRSLGSLPFNVTFGEYSPFLNKTGDW